MAAEAATHALVVGVGTYEDSRFRTLKADEDAKAFAATLGQLGIDDVTLLVNESATRAQISMWFAQVRVGPGDLVFVYIAGHGGGIADRTGREAEIGAFFPYDARKGLLALPDGDTAEGSSVITENDLGYWVTEELRGCNVVVFLDACRSALIARAGEESDSASAVRGEGALVPRGLTSAVRNVGDDGKTFVFTSSGEYEPSFEDPTPGVVPHGLFTRCLVNGLLCNADADQDGYVTYRELATYLTESMAQLTESDKLRGQVQTPVALCSPDVDETLGFQLARTTCAFVSRETGPKPPLVGGKVVVAAGDGKGSAEEVIFADQALARAVRTALRKPDGEKITRADCEVIDVLLAPDKGIQSLGGLEALTSLKTLDLRWNEINDLVPLTGLTEMRLLALDGNRVRDLGPLSELTRLMSLGLSVNDIVDAAPLVRLLEVKHLDLSHNRLVDIRPLGGIAKLEELNLLRNQVKDISPLAGKTELREFTLGSNQVSDVSPLAGMVQLGRLDLAENPVGDISVVAEMRGLKVLNLCGIKVSDASILANLQGLEELYLDNTGVIDVSPLAGLTQLRILSLNNNSIADASPLAGMVRLSRLELERNPVGDIGVVAEMRGLKVLNLCGIKVSDASILANLQGLEELYLDSTGVIDLSPLTPLTRLRILSLDDNAVRDVSPLAGLTELTDLWLSDNQIVDISPLAELTRLYLLILSSNGIVDISPLAGLTQLCGLGLDNNKVVDVSSLSRLTRLCMLSLAGNAVEDVSPLAGLLRLANLDLSQNHIADIDSLPLLARVNIDLLRRYDAVWLGRGAYLDLSGNPVTDVSALARQQLLEGVGLRATAVVDISPLTELPKLTTLYLCDNQIADVAPLAGMTELTTLGLEYNQITDIFALAGMTELTTLGLEHNQITDISALARMTKLTTLVLTSNQIADVAPLAGMTKLTKLVLTSNQIADVAPLAGMTELTELWLNANQITDISALARMTKLTTLVLTSNQIADVAPLAGMTELTELWLNANQITDISALAGMTRLTKLWLDGNEIAGITPLAGMEKLTQLDLYGLSAKAARGALEGWRLFRDQLYVAAYNGGYYTHPDPTATCHQFWSDGRYAKYDREGDGYHETIFLVQGSDLAYVGSLEKGAFADVTEPYAQYLGQGMATFLGDLDAFRYDLGQKAIPARPAASAMPLFADSFDDVKSGWQQDSEQSASGCAYSSTGEYALWTYEGRDIWAWAPLLGERPQDCIIEAIGYVFSGEGNAHFGVIWGPNTENFYSFCVAVDGSYCVAWKMGGTWQKPLVPARKSSAIIARAGAPNTLQVVINGDQATLEANGVRLATITVGIPGPYNVGLTGGGGDNARTAIRFVRFSVSTL